MAANQNFRTAFHGFNREDVVHYIDYLNAKHAAEVSQLNSELEYLRTRIAQEAEVSEVPAEPEVQEADPILEQQAARIRELFDQCQAQEQEIETLKAEKEQLAAALEQAKQAPVLTSTEEELECYRRAERAERLARERAGMVYTQVNSVLADATVKVEATAAHIGELSGQVMQQLNHLQAAVAGSKDALADAADIMYTIHPTAEE